MDGSLKISTSFPSLACITWASFLSSEPVTLHSMNDDKSTGLSLSAGKLTPDGVPETATSVSVHLERVTSNPRNRYNGVTLQDKLKTATVREKI